MAEHSVFARAGTLAAGVVCAGVDNKQKAHQQSPPSLSRERSVGAKRTLIWAAVALEADQNGPNRGSWQVAGESGTRSGWRWC